MTLEYIHRNTVLNLLPMSLLILSEYNLLWMVLDYSPLAVSLLTISVASGCFNKHKKTNEFYYTLNQFIGE